MSVSICEHTHENDVALYLILFYFLAEQDQALPEYLGAMGIRDARRFVKYLGVYQVPESPLPKESPSGNPCQG